MGIPVGTPYSEVAVACHRQQVSGCTPSGRKRVRNVSKQLLLAEDLTLLRVAVLDQEWGSLCNHNLLRKEDLGVALCELDSLYLQHQRREAFAAAYVTRSVVHGIHVPEKFSSSIKGSEL